MIAFIHNRRPGAAIVKHTHEYIANVTEPTCTEGGYTIYKCKCGETYESEYTEALGHDFGTEWLSDATGHWHGCSRCDEKKDFTFHVPGAEATTETPQTCVVCGYIITPALHVHAYGDWEITVAATCTTAGQKVRRCVCGVSEEEEIPALGHYLNYTVLKAPTCTSAGQEYFWCTRCNYSETYPMPFAPHTAEPIKRIPASCTESGSEGGKKCSVCNTILEEPKTLLPLGHSLDGTYRWDRTFHWKHCTKCNWMPESNVHIPVFSPSINAYYCEVCGAPTNSSGIADYDNI